MFAIKNVFNTYQQQALPRIYIPDARTRRGDLRNENKEKIEARRVSEKR